MPNRLHYVQLFHQVEIIFGGKMGFLQAIISSIRTVRSEMNVPPGKKAQLIYRTGDNNSEKLLLKHSHYLKQLAGIESINKYQTEADLKSTATTVVGKLEIFIPLAGLIDLEVEKQRMQKEIDRISCKTFSYCEHVLVWGQVDSATDQRGHQKP